MAEMDPYVRAKVTAMVIGYHHRWNAAQYEVIAVEREFNAPLVNPTTGAASRTWTLGGKVDAIVRDAEGRILVVEHKTAAEEIGPGSDYWKRLRLDGQVSIYFAGAESLGLKPDAVLYDVLAKPALRPYKATPLESRKYKADGTLYANQRAEDETPEQYLARCLADIAEDPAGYYQRGEVVRLEQEMSDALHDVWQLGKQIRESEIAGRFPRNPDACVRYSQTCPFFGVCTGEVALTDATRFRRSEHVNPELGENANARLLSASRLRAARACQRLHRLTYVDGWRPAVDAEALRLGTLVHAALEQWWLAPAGERLDAALAALEPNPQYAAEPVALEA